MQDLSHHFHPKSPTPHLPIYLKDPTHLPPLQMLPSTLHTQMSGHSGQTLCPLGYRSRKDAAPALEELTWAIPGCLGQQG